MNWGVVIGDKPNTKMEKIVTAALAVFFISILTAAILH